MSDSSSNVNQNMTVQSGDDLAAEALAQADQSNDSEALASDQLADTVTSLQNIIERNADQLDQLKNKLKLLREQMKSVFENDAELSDAQEQLDTYKQRSRERQSKLQADPTVTRLKVEIGELSEQKKEIEEALSDHLVNYYQLTNSTSFDTSDGDQREFQIRASVKGNRHKKDVAE